MERKDFMRGFQNCNIDLEHSGIRKTSLLIEGERIKAVSDAIGEGNELIPLPDGLIVVPGFIDEHIHGANGSDAMDAKEESLANISASLVKEGTTSFLYTTMTMEKGRILSALNAIDSYLKKKIYVAEPLGIHLEGPFISSAFKGAQNEADILPLSVADLDLFYKASGSRIREITYSYQRGHDDFLDYCKCHQIRLSLGHTENGAELAKEAFQKGTHLVTHMFNAMKGIHHRDIGTAGEAMLQDDVYCELIGDLHHVSEDAIRLLYKCKGKDRIILITDSMEAKYLPDGQYELGGNPVYVKDGTARLYDGTLAGSILKLNEGVRNIRKVLSLSLEDAVNMATINPARNLGIDMDYGSISEGKKADFAVIDQDIQIHMVVKNGKIVYRKDI